MIPVLIFLGNIDCGGLVYTSGANKRRSMNERISPVIDPKYIGDPKIIASASVSIFLSNGLRPSFTAHRPLLGLSMILHAKQLVHPLKSRSYKCTISVSAPCEAAPSSAFVSKVAVIPVFSRTSVDTDDRHILLSPFWLVNVQINRLIPFFGLYSVLVLCRPSM